MHVCLSTPTAPFPPAEWIGQVVTPRSWLDEEALVVSCALFSSSILTYKTLLTATPTSSGRLELLQPLSCGPDSEPGDQYRLLFTQFGATDDGQPAPRREWNHYNALVPLCWLSWIADLHLLPSYFGVGASDLQIEGSEVELY